jgi:hypothetical protein
VCVRACSSTTHFRMALDEFNVSRLTKCESTLSSAPKYPKDRCFMWNFLRLVPSVLLLIVVLRGRWVWNISGRKLTGRTRSNGRKTCPSAVLSTPNLTWTGSGPNLSLRSDRPATNSLSHGTTLRLNLIYILYKDSVCTARVYSAFLLERSISEQGNNGWYCGNHNEWVGNLCGQNSES